ncbi:MAG: SDR family oxidoreductase [Anaerolineales bacterium]|jgi:3-oxoacyl-[acyl-carrier protein] reductase
MDLGLEGMKALVTASSRGLGKAAAAALAAEGAAVALCSRTPEVHNTADEIRNATSALVHSVEADLTKPEDINRYVHESVDELGGVDILIINAGGPPPGGFLDLTPADWRAAVDLTLMSAVNLCYEVVPKMLEAGSGSIVTTQSYSVKHPIDNLILSNALRMAVIGLMKSMANELGPEGIRINSINPAWTWTERVEQLMKDRAERNNTSLDQEAGKVAEVVPLGRMGTVEEFGRSIAWLASPAASFIHGHALMFDGGATRFPL